MSPGDSSVFDVNLNPRKTRGLAASRRFRWRRGVPQVSSPYQRKPRERGKFVMLAVAEKVASISTIDYLEKRAERGSREKFLEILSKVSDAEPEEFDRL